MGGKTEGGRRRFTHVNESDDSNDGDASDDDGDDHDDDDDDDYDDNDDVGDDDAGDDDDDPAFSPDQLCSERNSARMGRSPSERIVRRVAVTLLRPSSNLPDKLCSEI